VPPAQTNIGSLQYFKSAEVRQNTAAYGIWVCKPV
jgi:hypothetical protein